MYETFYINTIKCFARGYKMSLHDGSRRKNKLKTTPPSKKDCIDNRNFIEMVSGAISVYLADLERSAVNSMFIVSLPDLKKKFGYFNNACRRIEFLDKLKPNDESRLERIVLENRVD